LLYWLRWWCVWRSLISYPRGCQDTLLSETTRCLCFRVWAGRNWQYCLTLGNVPILIPLHVVFLVADWVFTLVWRGIIAPLLCCYVIVTFFNRHTGWNKLVENLTFLLGFPVLFVCFICYVVLKKAVVVIALLQPLCQGFCRLLIGRSCGMLYYIP